MKRFFCMIVVLLLAILTAACGGGKQAGNTGPAASKNETQQTEQKNTNTPSQEEKKLNYPEKTLNWTIAFGPGGGNDIMSRTIIDILKKYNLYTQPIIAENRQGGSGAVGWGYLNSHRGDPYHISSTSGSFITTPLVSDPGFNYTSFTHVGLMATDDLVFLSHGESDIRTLEDMINRAKNGKLSLGGIGSVNVDKIVPDLLAEKAGFTYEYVPFQGAGELTSALLSKSLDVMVSNPAEVLGHIEAGQMIPLAYSGMKRVSKLPDVPTLSELGYDGVTVSMPRGIILAGDVPVEIRDWWIETMKKVAETPEWKKYIEDNALTEYLLWGDDFTQYLKETSEAFEKLVKK